MFSVCFCHLWDHMYHMLTIVDIWWLLCLLHVSWQWGREIVVPLRMKSERESSKEVSPSFEITFPWANHGFDMSEFCHGHSRARITIVTNHVLQILLVYVFPCVPGHDVLVPIVPRRMWPASESEEGLFLTWGHDFLNRQDVFILFSDVFCMFLSFVGSHVSHVDNCWHMVTIVPVTCFMAVRKRNSRSTSDEIWKRIVEGGVAFFWDHFSLSQPCVFPHNLRLCWWFEPNGLFTHL